MTIAGESPLVVAITSISLTSEDLEYLKSLSKEKWKARITYVVAMRPDIECISLIREMKAQKHERIWVLPVLPDIANYNKNNGYITAQISIDGVKNSKDYYIFRNNLLQFEIYCNSYRCVQKDLPKIAVPHQIFFFANQEMLYSDFINLNCIFNSAEDYNGRMIIAQNDKLIMLDALAYYMVVNERMEEAIKYSQAFFLYLLVNMMSFSTYNSVQREYVRSILKNASIKKQNVLAQGFSRFFTSLALNVSTFLSNHSAPYILRFLNLLSSEIYLEFSVGILEGLTAIHIETQYCSFLDYGLLSIEKYFSELSKSQSVPQSTLDRIHSFFTYCISTANKWSDLTLIEGVVKAQKAMVLSENRVLIDPPENETLKYSYFQLLKKERIKREDVIMENKKVFIVHGHDNSAKVEVAYFLSKAGFDPIILHEQPDLGQTIIEKIESNSDVGYAIVLYTECDLGRAKEKGEDANQFRARQNVVFEHGYLIAKLKRDHVIALVKGKVEIPGDISGVVYTTMDDAGAWKNKVANNMIAVGIDFDKTKIV